MLALLKNVQGEVYPNIIDNVKYVSSIYGEIQQEDYINLNGFMAFLQNLTRAEETAALQIPLSFGLKDTYNKTMVTLEISY
jgi:hypothetical protein